MCPVMNRTPVQGVLPALISGAVPLDCLHACLTILLICSASLQCEKTLFGSECSEYGAEAEAGFKMNGNKHCKYCKSFKQ